MMMLMMIIVQVKCFSSPLSTFELEGASADDSEQRVMSAPPTLPLWPVEQDQVQNTVRYVPWRLRLITLSLPLFVSQEVRGEEAGTRGFLRLNTV